MSIDQPVQISALIVGVRGHGLEATDINIKADYPEVEEIKARDLTSEADVLLIQQAALQHFWERGFEFSEWGTPEKPVLVYGPDQGDTPMLDALAIGARGYVAEGAPPEEIHLALQDVASGRLWLDREVMENLALKAVEMERILAENVRQKFQSLSSLLPKRELQVLQGIVRGQSTREIADEIFISEQSVKLYLSRLFKKFEVSNRSQLILVVFDRISPVADIMKLF
ncbi:MAG: LuxR C-terminal-related transcriptional regulator [bacterium]